MVEPPAPWVLSDDGERFVLRHKAKDFAAVLALANQVGAIAEAQNHHPDIHIEGWNNLRLETYSHDVGALTDRDVRLAEAVAALLS